MTKPHQLHRAIIIRVQTIYRFARKYQAQIMHNLISEQFVMTFTPMMFHKQQHQKIKHLNLKYQQVNFL
ncbi:hypothetical protein CW735_10070 [Alteromonas sp. MB-3u-76]|nr:hypothetical protein CW735_10070 [Alteromonas sp. MB-3u-76]